MPNTVKYMVVTPTTVVDVLKRLRKFSSVRWIDGCDILDNLETTEEMAMDGFVNLLLEGPGASLSEEKGSEKLIELDFFAAVQVRFPV